VVGPAGATRLDEAQRAGWAWRPRARWAGTFTLAVTVVGIAWWSDPHARAADVAGELGAPAVPGEHAEPRSGELGQSRVLPYPMEHVWPTAVRYLRVDRGYTIVDRDPEAGFILFDFPIGPDDRVGRGSVELFATKDASGRASASVSVSTDGGPLHLPHAILDGLGDKLRRERGQPSAPPQPQPDTPPKGKDPPKDNSKLKPVDPPEDDGLIIDG
jgi:hypothetical protein